MRNLLVSKHVRICCPILYILRDWAWDFRETL